MTRKMPKFAEYVGSSNNVSKLRNRERKILKLSYSNFVPRQKLLELPRRKRGRSLLKRVYRGLAAAHLSQ